MAVMQINLHDLVDLIAQRNYVHKVQRNSSQYRRCCELDSCNALIRVGRYILVKLEGSLLRLILCDRYNIYPL